MNRTAAMAGWLVASVALGWNLHGVARAQSASRVECKAFYQDFPDGIVAPDRALAKAEELGAKLDPWLEQQLGAGARGVMVHSFVPYGLKGGAELICVAL